MSALYSRVVAGLLFPLHERLKGHDTVSILREIERTQWLPAEALRAEQGQRLAVFMASVAEQVPFYRDLFRERGLRAGDFTDASALAMLPTSDKAMIRANFAGLRADGASGLAQQRTSGSSGEPLAFLLGRHRVAFDIAAKWRATRWWDVDLGDREAVLWGSAIETGHQDRVRALRDALFRSRLIPTHGLNAARMDAILAGMRDYRPRMLFGYPSALAQLAFRARETGMRMDDLGIRVAFCTSEVLRPEWREAISGAFGCGVANEYGARDAGFIARECPHGGLHITAEEVVVEVVDEHGQPLAHGEEGDIVVTNLAGPEFPFIRYRTGDRGVLGDEPCPCGRGLPVLEKVAGRANDGLVGADGAWIHGSAVNHLMRDIAGLRAYRIEQQTLERVEVLLCLDDALTDACADRLGRHLETLLGGRLEVGIRQVDTIPPLPNGKFRHIICNVHREQGPQSHAQPARTEQ
ncbi:phenylacetate--CoA ligase family protein [Rhodocyclaceae bacterium SMB388]